MEIAIDFDGTCVTHEFPRVGKDIGAVPVLLDLISAGHNLILYTMRSNVTDLQADDKKIVTVGGNYLTDAINWFKKNDIPLYGVQKNPAQYQWTKSPKCYAHLYIDDAALGCPLIESDLSKSPYVDWKAVREMLYVKNILKRAESNA